MDHVAFGQRLKAVRRAKGVRRRSLALLCGVSEEHLRNIEAGQCGASMRLLGKLTWHLSVSASILLDEREGAVA